MTAKCHQVGKKGPTCFFCCGDGNNTWWNCLYLHSLSDPTGHGAKTILSQLCWWGKGGTELDGESDGGEADTGTSQDPPPGLAGGCRGGRVGKLHHTHLSVSWRLIELTCPSKIVSKEVKRWISYAIGYGKSQMYHTLTQGKKKNVRGWSLHILK